MMSRIERIKETVMARRAARTKADRAAGGNTTASSNLPVPIGPVVTHNRAIRDDRGGGDSEFAAQLMGQDGQRRGLRAGPPMLETARTAYSRTEWSGSYDRRAPAGRMTRKVI